MMVLRSMLFVPGNSMRMITKAATLAADGIIFDLEDAVPLPDKETARIMIRDSIKPVKSGGACDPIVMRGSVDVLMSICFSLTGT